MATDGETFSNLTLTEQARCLDQAMHCKADLKLAASGHPFILGSFVPTCDLRYAARRVQHRCRPFRMDDVISIRVACGLARELGNDHHTLLEAGSLQLSEAALTARADSSI